MTGEYLLNIKGVTAKVALSASRIYEMVNEGAFPQPLAIGGASRWRGSDVDGWIVELASQPRVSRHGRTADQVSA